MKTYIAFTSEGEIQKAYICEAESKKQMKERGMNMRLDWNTVKDFSTALARIEEEGAKLAMSSRL